MSGNDTVEADIRLPAEGRELRGGLLLFIAWLGVIGPTYSLALNCYFAMRWSAMSHGAASYFASWSFWWFIAAREASRMIAALVLATQRSAYAVRFAILIIWLSGPPLVIGSWLLPGTVIIPGALVRSSAIAAAATLYLLRSTQVRNVYGIPPTLRKLASS